MRLTKRLKSRGDTIVEVLIAMAVISLVLSGAYVTTQKSVIATRDAQERSEGLKLLEGQIESIRNLAATNSSAIFLPPANKPPANNFCISSTGSTVNSSPSTSSSLPNLDSDTYQSTYYAPGCTRLNPGGIYNIIIQYNNATSTFSLTNRWDRVGGGKDQVSLVYRVYP